MNIEKIFVVVQSCGYKNKYRLGINSKYSQELFRERGVNVCLVLSDSLTVNVQTTCGIPTNPIKDKKYKKGFDLYSSEISDWIIKSSLHCYEYRKPYKLEFEYCKINSTHNLIFTGTIDRREKNIDQQFNQ